MTKIEDYHDAVEVLQSYDVLPVPLMPPAYLVAFNDEYGFRPVVRGIVKHTVNQYENRDAVLPTPDYEAVAIPPRVSFWQDVDTIAGHLERHPTKNRPAFYWKLTRQWYYDALEINEVMQMIGFAWVTVRKVREAMKQVKRTS